MKPPRAEAVSSAGAVVNRPLPGYGPDFSHFDHAQGLLYHDHGPPAEQPTAPALVYVPGVQGDWTPMHRTGALIAEFSRLVLTAYPRNPAWTLEDHARAVLAVLDHLGLERAHLLAESYGSLVAWQVALLAPQRVQSIAIAGGFVLSPQRVGAACAAVFHRHGPPWLMEAMVQGYLRWATRHSRHPEIASFRRSCFPAIRAPQGWQALANRMRIIARADMRPHLPAIQCPVGYFGGAWDVVVPVRREIRTLRRGLGQACRFRAELFPRTAHDVLPARPRESAAWIRQWLGECES